jgi:aminoglycoside phosphotransferase (APT) family kinase protein
MNEHEKYAKAILLKAGFSPKKIHYIPEGSNHEVFLITMEDGKEEILKLPSQRYTEDNGHTDTLFGGELSLKRESSLYHLARNAGVPAPEVFSWSPTDPAYILMEKMPGKSYVSFLEDSNFSKKTFLDSLSALGEDFAKIHQIRFDSFGDIQGEHEIMPQGIDNFSDRFSSIMEMRIDKAEKKGALLAKEAAGARQFFRQKFESLRPLLDREVKPPTMVFTDMHGDNFFVDENGKPSGYFDLESAQAAPAELEFYGFRFFLFNYYDQATFIEAEAAFFTGYEAAGGAFAPKTKEDHQLIDLLAGCRLLELTESYWGYVDGLRDNWAVEIKAILLDYLQTSIVDYVSLADVFRPKTGQPKQPNA